ncbi:MAG: hypothetical protein JWP89_850 [Schlesneria sp.]|nr:hypothetical protein [Schlesneria sp.]
MSETIECDEKDDLVKDVYAHFGLAYYHSECLLRGACFLHAFRDMPARNLVTRPIVEEKLAYAFSLTLGEVVRDLESFLSAAEVIELGDAVKKRNFLAHHFWFERIHLMYVPGGIQTLVDELNEYTEVFMRADANLSKKYTPTLESFGMTEEVVQASKERILSGEFEEPLPDRDELRAVGKKLGRVQRITHVWEATSHSAKPLIFEFDDGTLWQLSHIGLGPTHFRRVEDNWIEHPAVQPHLPADIIPRPKNAKHWEFDFMLRDGAKFWVRPNAQGGTFMWGVNTKVVRTVS